MNNKADPINLVVLASAVIFGPEVAEKVSPHVVVFIAASAGAGWAMLTPGADKSAKYIISYWVAATITALFITSGVSAIVASIIGHYFAGIDVNILLAPIAFLVGAAAKWWGVAAKLVVALVHKFTKSGGSSG